MELRDISYELFRTYDYGTSKIKISNPSKITRREINFDGQRGYLIVDSGGYQHVIANGWLRVNIKVREGYSAQNTINDI